MHLENLEAPEEPKRGPDSEAMRDFLWGATRPLKPLRKFCDLDLMFAGLRGDKDARTVIKEHGGEG